MNGYDLPRRLRSCGRTRGNRREKQLKLENVSVVRGEKWSRGVSWGGC